MTLITFGAVQYQWHPDGVNSWANPDGPAVKSSITADGQTLFELPKASMMVIRGKVGGE